MPLGLTDSWQNDFAYGVGMVWLTTVGGSIAVWCGEGLSNKRRGGGRGVTSWQGFFSSLVWWEQANQRPESTASVYQY